MDRRFAWLGAAVGALAVWRWRRRKTSVEADPAESRVATDDVVTTTADDANPDARRRSVHEDARARIDELRGE